MTDDVFARGVAEDAKGCVHLVLFGVLCAVGAYNGIACLVRPSWRLGFNAALYGGFALYEARQTRGHFRDAAQGD